VNTRGQEFIKFTKANIQHEKKQNIKTTKYASYAYTNASHVSHMSYHDFDASYVLMRIRLENHCLACWATPQEVKDFCVSAQVPC
jgi:O-glycosyl hydrolase